MEEVYVPAINADSDPWTLPLEDIDKAVNRYSAEFFILATFVTILLVAFLIFFTTIKIRKPLNAIVKASRAVANGDHSTRLELMPKQLGDIRMVSLAFNEMLDNLNAATRELQNWSHQLEYKVEKKSEELEEVQNELIHIEKIDCEIYQRVSEKGTSGFIPYRGAAQSAG